MSASCVDNTGLGAGTKTCTFTSGPHNGRTYRIHVPASGSGARPLMVVLHGGGTCEDNGANDMRTVVNMETQGDLLNGGNGVLIAYPRSGMQKNGISTCGDAHPFNWDLGPESFALIGTNVTDVAFVNAVIADIKSQWSVDATQVGVCGHSGGAFIALRMICEPAGNDHATVVWALSGSLTAQEVANCTNSTPTRVHIVTGTTDTAVPTVGGITIGTIVFEPIGQVAYQIIAQTARGGSGSPSSWTSTKFGLDSDGECITTSKHLRAGIPNANYDVMVYTMGCGAAVPIHTAPPDGCYTANGMGHRWPGYAGGYGVGTQIMAFNASATILSTITGS